MMYQVTEQWLERLCRGRPEEISGPRAYGVVARMGPLAPWWLREEVLQKARTYAIQIHPETQEAQRWCASWEPVRRAPEESGCCWLLLVNRRPEDLGLLRPAFVLPVRWVKDQPHHPHLPEGLRRLADQVLEQLRKEKQIDPHIRWGLQPAWQWWLAHRDLSRLEWQRWESVWVPLAAGLLLAYSEGRPDPTVWATGAYQPGQGIGQVEGVGPKALAAWQMGAKVLFVPPGQDEEVRQFLTEQGLGNELEVRCFPAGPSKLHKCLADYLNYLEVPPGPDAPPKRRQEYFLRIPDDETARRYYTQFILPDVWKQKAPDLAELRPTHLAIIVSKGYDLVELAVGLVRPQRCLLLFNEEMKEESQKIPTRLKERQLECDCAAWQFMGKKHEDLVREFRQAISEFLGQTPPEQLIVDLTAGQKSMSLALYDAAPEGCVVMCCQTGMAKNSRRPAPFEEQIDYWKVARHSNM